MTPCLPKLAPISLECDAPPKPLCQPHLLRHYRLILICLSSHLKIGLMRTLRLIGTTFFLSNYHLTINSKVQNGTQHR
jgi:hypothetical protein